MRNFSTVINKMKDKRGKIKRYAVADFYSQHIDDLCDIVILFFIFDLVPSIYSNNPIFSTQVRIVDNHLKDFTKRVFT